MAHATHGFSVRGIGVDTSSASNEGALYVYGSQAPDVTDYTVIGAALTDPMDIKGISTKVQGGKLSLPAGSATLHAQVSDVTDTLLSVQGAPPYRLDADITSGDQTIELAEGGGLFADLPTAVWIGDEALRVNTDGGSGTYRVDRGYWGSDAISHGAGAGVYDRPPYMRNRIVDFWQIQKNGTLVSRGSGYIKDMPVRDALTTMTIQFESRGQRLKGISRNRVAVPLDGEGADPGVTEVDSMRVDEDTISNRPGNVMINTIPRDPEFGFFSPQVAKPEDSNGNNWQNYYDIHLQYKDAIFRSYRSASNQYPAYRLSPDFPGNPSELDLEDDDESQVWELFAIQGGDEPKTPWDNANLPSDIPPDHPWTIAAVLLFSSDSRQADPSSFDLLQGEWGLDAGFLFGQDGLDSFKDAIRSTPTLKIDQYILGWDGESFETMQEVLDLVVGYGGYFAVAADGTLRLKDYAPPTNGDFNAATEVTPLLGIEQTPKMEWSPGYETAKQAYRASVGDTPVSDGSPRTVFPLEASSRLRIYQEGDAVEYDYSFLNPSNESRVTAILSRQAELWRQRLPSITMEVPPKDDGSGYDVGEYVVPTLPDDCDDIFFDADGTLIDASSKQVDLLTLVLDVQWEPERDVYTISGPLTAYRNGLVKVRAPAGLIESVTDNGDGTATFDLGSSSFGNLDGDGQEFIVGQSVEVYDHILAPTDGASYEVTATTDTTVTVDSVPSNLTAINSAPPQHYTLRLHEYDSALSERVHVYLADTNDTLGTANDPADKYA